MGGLWGAAGLRRKQQHAGWWVWVASTHHRVRGLNILIHKDLHTASEKLTSWEVKCNTVSCSLHIWEAKDKGAHQIIRQHTWMFSMDHHDVSICLHVTLSGEWLHARCPAVIEAPPRALFNPSDHYHPRSLFFHSDPPLFHIYELLWLPSLPLSGSCFPPMINGNIVHAVINCKQMIVNAGGARSLHY